MAINLTSWNNFFLPPEVAESVVGVRGLPAKPVLVPLPQGASQGLLSRAEPPADQAPRAVPLPRYFWQGHSQMLCFKMTHV